MQLPPELFLALRYLKPKRSFVSIITLLSILGPILGVALLVIVTSVMSGFDQEIKTRILSMQSHLQILPLSSFDGNTGVISDPDPLLKKVSQAGADAAPLIEGPVLVQVRNKITAKYVKGIVPALEKKVSGLADSVRGRFEIKDGEALIGEELALELGLRIGDQFLIHSPSKLTRNMEWQTDGRVKTKDTGEVYLPEEVTIVGIFSMGVYEFDSGLIFMQLDQAAELFGLPWGSATSLQVRTPDPFNLTPIIIRLKKEMPLSRIVSWQEANSKLFGALRVEKNLMSFLLVFIVIVAAFGITGTLITVVIQKTREVGILKAVGMTNGTVARVFLLQGVFIGVTGTALGTLLGALIVQFRNLIAMLLSKIMGVEIFPRSLYQLTEIPGRIIPSDLAVIVVLSLAICIAGALIPALYAAHLSPSEAIREEN